MSAFEISFRPDANLLPPVLSSVKVYAKQFFEVKADVDRIVLSLEEAVNNVLNYSSARYLDKITVTVDSADGKFTVCVLDKGLPGNYDETLKDDDRLGLTIMENSVDELQVENLGHNGRRQTLIKYYAKLPDTATESKAEDIVPIENAVITVRTANPEDALSICRAVYDEYGFTYFREYIYYPERFNACVESGQLYSIVAVDQAGNFAGHFSSISRDDYPGVWEVGMAVVKGQYRGAGIFTKLMKYNLDFIQNSSGCKLCLSFCNALHPYSQKTHKNFDFSPCGFNFNVLPPDVFTSSSLDACQYLHEALCAIAYDFSERTVYLPDEIRDIANYIFGSMKLPRKIIVADLSPKAEHTKSSWSFDSRSRTGSISVTEIGQDFSARLRSDIFELRIRGSEMIMLKINSGMPGSVRLYEAAKNEGFFFTALIPNVETGDVMIMQKMMKKNVDYDRIVTVEPFTSLLEMIRKFDPDEKQVHLPG